MTLFRSPPPVFGIFILLATIGFFVPYFPINKMLVEIVYIKFIVLLALVSYLHVRANLIRPKFTPDKGLLAVTLLILGFSCYLRSFGPVFWFVLVLALFAPVKVYAIKRRRETS